jgi:hypothetical protein
MSECYVSLTQIVMQEEYTGIYPDSGRESPTSSGGREFCIFLHLSACVGVTSWRERAPSPSLKENERVQGWLLEMLISELDAFACWHLASNLPLFSL